MVARSWRPERVSRGWCNKSRNTGAAMNTQSAERFFLHKAKCLQADRDRIVDAVQVDRAESATARADTACPSLRSWGEKWLERREREGVRSVKDDRARWRLHIAGEPWASLPMSVITPTHARDWWSRMHEKGSGNPTHKEERRARPLAANTLQNVLGVVRGMFSEALAEGLVERNVFEPLRVRRTRRARTRLAWTPLRPEEYETAFAPIAHLDEAPIVGVALGSGLRASEQWSLRLEDVDVESDRPSMLVRFGCVSLTRPRGSVSCEHLDGAWFQPTKGGKPRRVRLFGLALESMRAWLRALPSYAPANPQGLVFPCRNGRPRRKGRVFRGFSRVGRALGRRFRWHDLRHSCVSSLVGGWWGFTWTLEQARVFVGHSSIDVTEQYAHFAADLCDDAADQTHGQKDTRDRNNEHKAGVTMVDGSNGATVEATDSSPRSSARIEQRFPNTESAPSTGAEKLPQALQNAAGNGEAKGAAISLADHIREHAEARAVYSRLVRAIGDIEAERDEARELAASEATSRQDAERERDRAIRDRDEALRLRDVDAVHFGEIIERYARAKTDAEAMAAAVRRTTDRLRTTVHGSSSVLPVAFSIGDAVRHPSGMVGRVVEVFEGCVGVHVDGERHNWDSRGGEGLELVGVGRASREDVARPLTAQAFRERARLVIERAGASESSAAAIELFAEEFADVANRMRELGEARAEGVAARLREAIGLLNDADRVGAQISAFLDREVKR